MTRLQSIHTVIQIVRDLLLIAVLLAGIVFGAGILRNLSEQASKLPEYCYANDARSSAPECKQDD